MAAFHGRSGDSNSIYLLRLSDSTEPSIFFITIPFSIVRQKQFHNFLISIVLVAVATEFMLFVRMMTSTTCPYYHVQRCIAFHQFQFILLFFNWHGPDRSADTVKWKAITVDSRKIALIRKLSAKTKVRIVLFLPNFHFYNHTSSSRFKPTCIWFYQSQFINALPR